MSHLAGNFLLFKGAKAFNQYAQSLEDLGVLLYGIEVALAGLFLVHIFFALWVSKENFQARPEKYVVKNWAGKRTLGSSTMPITGLLVLVFLAVHLFNFRYAKVIHPDKSLYDLVAELFQSAPYVAYYVLSVFVLGIHLSHGLQSVTRTLGLSNPRYLNLVRFVSYFFSVAITLGYASIPLYFYCFKGGPA